MTLRLSIAAAALALLGGCAGPMDRISPCACDWERISPTEPTGDLA